LDYAECAVILCTGGHVTRLLTAIIEREGDRYVSLCPELDIASAGDTVPEARANLQEALELFFETASPQEVTSRFRGEVYVTQVEVAVP
jgi:predicted RNase H-like HicB family nuclease